MRAFIKTIYSSICPWRDVSRKIYAVYVRMDNSNKKKRKIRAQYYCYLIEKKFGCVISPGAIIGKNFKMPHPNGVVIGKNSKIGKGVTIYQQVTIGQNRDKYPTIGDNVIIYAGARIVGDIHVGDNSIIGANAVVTKDVPNNSIWGGIPAKEIKKRDSGANYI